MTMISARVPFTPTKLSATYSNSEMFSEHGKIQRAISPMTTRNVIAATTVQTTDDLIVCDTTSGNFAVILPQVSQAQFLRVTIINIGGNTVTITGTVSGTVNPTLAQWKSAIIQGDGTRWMKIGGIV